MRSIPKIIATVLASGGVFWACFLVFVSLTTQSLQFLSMFALGFLIWGLWIIRAKSRNLHVHYKRLIWSASIAYNLFWLIRFLQSPASQPSLYTSWWALAAGLSLVAIILESEETETDRQA